MLRNIWLKAISKFSRYIDENKPGPWTRWPACSRTRIQLSLPGLMIWSKISYRDFILAYRVFATPGQRSPPLCRCWTQQALHPVSRGVKEARQQAPQACMLLTWERSRDVSLDVISTAALLIINQKWVIEYYLKHVDDLWNRPSTSSEFPH
jgi:hypothetical protein